MLRSILTVFMLPVLLLLGSSSDNSAARVRQKSNEIQTETVEKLIVASGSATMDVDLDRLNDAGSSAKESKPLGPELVAEGLDTLRFQVRPNSSFTILVFNNVLRGPELGSMGLIWGNSAILPEPLNASSNQLVIEKLPADAPFDLVVRDGKTGFVFFNLEGVLYDYDAAVHLLSIKGGRLLISEEFANKLGRPADAGVIVGEISMGATMQPIEITQLDEN